MGCRHPCRRHRHRRHCKTWVAGMPARVAGIPVVVAGTAGTGKQGLQASSSSTQASQTGPARVAGIFAFVAGTANASNHGFQACLRGWQASLSSSQAPQARENMGCKHPLPRRSHRRPGKTWIAGIFAFVAGTANASNHGLQACLRGLQACMCGSQASQTLQITGAGMPARLEF